MRTALQRWAASAAVVVAGFALGCAAGGPGAESGAGSGAAAVSNAYTCANGKLIRIEGWGTPQAGLSLPDGQQVRLPAVEGFGGKKYSNGAITLSLENGKANVTFSSSREPLLGCVAPK